MHVPPFINIIVHKRYLSSQCYVLVGSLLLCIQHLSCLVNFQCMLRGIVEV